jgi:mannose-1-phosphate guanylyltransferase
MGLVPVIICGGAGARLWPVSREGHPKPFIKLEDGQSLLQHTLRRVCLLDGIEGLVTVTNKDLRFAVDQEYKAAGIPLPRLTYVLEPFARDTAAAIAMAALEVERTYGSKATIGVFPADHVIEGDDDFAAAIANAVELARDGNAVVIGIKPDRAETGYGYIEAEGTTVKRFVEKPDIATAEAFLSDHRYYWNAGMLCVNVNVLLGLYEKHCPDIIASCRAAFNSSVRSTFDAAEHMEIDAEAFSQVRKQSLDYAILEQAEQIAVVTADMGWTDVGSWLALGRRMQQDHDGNMVSGDVRIVNGNNNIVRSEDRLIGVVGVDDLIVVDTADALLVTSMSRAQDVKELFSQLKKEGHKAYREHRTVHRPWGTYTVLEEGERFKIKRIEVKPRGRLSLQMHHHRSEHWVVVSGTALVVNGEEEAILTTNQSTYIPCGQKHRLENPGIMKLILIEVQTGDYLGEDDIVRFDDVYGRS